jgi:uncharacterized protein (UPF0332 family)
VSYVQKAKESLKSARILYEAECYNSCVSRCYYAMFQMAIAALLELGIHPPREAGITHAWVQAAVARELIHRRKLLPTRLARTLPNVFALRAETDYGPALLGKKRVKRALNTCQRFLETIQQEVLSHGEG